MSRVDENKAMLESLHGYGEVLADISKSLALIADIEKKKFELDHPYINIVINEEGENTNGRK